MKSKRRHELQTNELADRLGHWIDRIRPYATTFLLVVVGGAAIIAAWYYYASSKEGRVSRAWAAYFRAGSDPGVNLVDDLGAVADQYSDTTAGLWAAQTAADLDSAHGVRLLFRDKASAETSLNRARSRYQEVLESQYAKKNPMLARRAHFGLAQTYETQNELEKAKEHYEAIIDSSPDSAFGKAAKRRLERIEQATTKGWYNWFARQTPVLPKVDTSAIFPAGSGLGAPGSDLGTLSDGPGADFLKGDTSSSSKTPPKDAAKDDTASEEPAKAKQTTPDESKQDAKPAGADSSPKPAGTSESGAKTDEKKSAEKSAEKPAK